jgi:HAD superfamily hydrolase (TIGR01509 family)
MLKALLFDLDGTLANTDPLHQIVWQQLLEPYGYQVDALFYRQRISGRLNQDLVRELLPQFYPDQEPQLSAHKEAQFRTLAADRLSPMPGLRELLDWGRQQSLAMAVVTNAPRANAEFVLKTLGLSEQFEPVILAAELPAGKPDPLPYQEALRQLAIDAPEAIAFEDSVSGVTAAVGAEVTTVGIASTHPAELLYAAGAALVVPDFSDQRLRQFDLLTQL